MTPSTIVVCEPARRALDRARDVAGKSVAWSLLADRVSHGLLAERFLGREQRSTLAGFFRDASARTRAAFIERVGSLVVESRGDRWATWLAEKNPFVSRIFTYLVWLDAAVAWVRSGPADVVVLVADSRALRAALAGELRRTGYHVVLLERPLSGLISTLRALAGAIAKRGYFVVRECERIAIAAARDGRSLSLRTALARPVTLVHSWVDRRAFDPATGRYDEPDFNRIFDHLAGTDCNPVFLPSVLRVTPFGAFAEFARNDIRPILLPYSFLTVTDVLRALWIGTLRRSAYPRNFECAGYDIAPLLAEDARREWSVQRHCSDALYAVLIRRLERSGVRVRGLLYTFENHLWERRTCAAIRKHYPRAHIIGYQPGRVPPLLLNYFGTSAESAVVPLPDLVLTNGEYATRLLREWMGARVRTGAAFRQQHLVSTAPGSRASGATTILVAPAILGDEGAELLLQTWHAFKDEPGNRVVVRCHPTVPLRQLMSDAGIDHLPAHFSESRSSLSDDLLGAGVVVYTTSAIALEAIALSVPVVHVGIETGIDTEPLADRPDLRPVADTPAALRDAVLAILQRRADYVRDKQPAWAALIRDYFAPVTPEALSLFCPPPSPGTTRTGDPTA